MQSQGVGENSGFKVALRLLLFLKVYVVVFIAFLLIELIFGSPVYFQIVLLPHLDRRLLFFTGLISIISLVSAFSIIVIQHDKYRLGDIAVFGESP